MPVTTAGARAYFPGSRDQPVPRILPTSQTIFVPCDYLIIVTTVSAVSMFVERGQSVVDGEMKLENGYSFRNSHSRVLIKMLLLLFITFLQDLPIYLYQLHILQLTWVQVRKELCVLAMGMENDVTEHVNAVVGEEPIFLRVFEASLSGVLLHERLIISRHFIEYQENIMNLNRGCHLDEWSCKNSAKFKVSRLAMKHILQINIHACGSYILCVMRNAILNSVRGISVHSHRAIANGERSICDDGQHILQLGGVEKLAFFFNLMTKKHCSFWFDSNIVNYLGYWLVGYQNPSSAFMYCIWRRWAVWCSAKNDTDFTNPPSPEQSSRTNSFGSIFFSFVTQTCLLNSTMAALRRTRYHMQKKDARCCMHYSGAEESSELSSASGQYKAFVYFLGESRWKRALTDDHLNYARGARSLRKQFITIVALNGVNYLIGKAKLISGLNRHAFNHYSASNFVLRLLL
ncbi:hypothetical protein CLF_108110 [Clonorchis sinensis]|uniref:Uncharacterized protein n=1 Tax=Clonorchis sinensis TaxID=79923 RepID=G7YRA5_CLOSI|nr:hypothetical protein CLF_108110 [Clonorchis sinensis]